MLAGGWGFGKGGEGDGKAGAAAGLADCSELVLNKQGLTDREEGVFHLCL